MAALPSKFHEFCEPLPSAKDLTFAEAALMDMILRSGLGAHSASKSNQMSLLAIVSVGPGHINFACMRSGRPAELLCSTVIGKIHAQSAGASLLFQILGRAKL